MDSNKPQSQRQLRTGPVCRSCPGRSRSSGGTPQMSTGCCAILSDLDSSCLCMKRERTQVLNRKEHNVKLLLFSKFYTENNTMFKNFPSSLCEVNFIWNAYSMILWYLEDLCKILKRKFHLKCILHIFKISYEVHIT